jgi:hypothetical protein
MPMRVHARREDETWRMALHQECCQNIDLGKERPADGPWSLDTSVLSDSSRHASAFSADVLQRIIWARTANERLEARLSSLRAGRLPWPDTSAAQLRARCSRRSPRSRSSCDPNWPPTVEAGQVRVCDAV